MPNLTKQYYNRIAEKWASRKTHSFFHEKQFRIFLSYFKKGDRVLDIGCAQGIHVPLFLGIGRKLKYEGIDISRSFLKIARSRYPQLSFMEGDVADGRTLPRKRYDGFWAAAVLMHVPIEKWPLMMRNIEGRMRPGAVGYITLPKKRVVHKAEDTRHFEIFDQARFKRIAKEEGWEVLRTGVSEATETMEWYWYLVRLPS